MPLSDTRVHRLQDFGRRLGTRRRRTIMNAKKTFGLAAMLLAAVPGMPTDLAAAPVTGWLAWRGPQQNGFSAEKNLPDQVDPKHPLWRADFPGQSTPVIANGKLFIMGYLGEG